MSHRPTKNRPFLKWLGGKTRLIHHITSMLPAGKVLAEPFVGSASVFLNTDYEFYYLNDINPDLIHLYRHLQQDAKVLIAHIKKLFHGRNNREKSYYSFRDRFNDSSCTLERSALFVYLNRHGYNGLCRYNQQGYFNVPFGRYVAPYLPIHELEMFAQKSQRAEISCLDYREILENTLRHSKESVIYCDPPYVPLTKTANFTEYAAKKFTMEDQQWLAATAQQLAESGCSVLISNHDTVFTRKLYRAAEIISFPVPRFVSAKAAERKSVQELLALFSSNSLYS